MLSVCEAAAVRELSYPSILRFFNAGRQLTIKYANRYIPVSIFPKGRDRAEARAPLAEGFQHHPFRDCVAWVHSSSGPPTIPYGRSGRNTARATVGGEFPTRTLSVCTAGS